MHQQQRRPAATSACTQAVSAGHPPTVTLLGLAFADLTAEAAARIIAARAADAAFAYVVTPNADHFCRLSRNPSLLPIYQNAWLRLMDSRVVAHAGRLLGLPMPTVATGSDVTRLLLTDHIRPGERVTIIGLEPALLPALVAQCRLTPPAHCCPPFGFDQQPETLQPVVEFVLNNPARLIFIAVGSPRQERLCEALLASGQAAGTALCIGASLEYLTGRKERAPTWMQLAGMEWLHRLLGEPRRLARRYLMDSPLVFRLLLRDRMGDKSGPDFALHPAAPVGHR